MQCVYQTKEMHENGYFLIPDNAVHPCAVWENEATALTWSSLCVTYNCSSCQPLEGPTGPGASG